MLKKAGFLFFTFTDKYRIDEIERKKKPNRYRKNRKTSYKGKKTTSKRKEESQVSQGSKTNPAAKKTRTPRNRRADKTEA